MLRQKSWRKSKHIVYVQQIFPNSCSLRDNVEKLCRAGKATDDNITWLMRFTCWIIKATNTNSEYVIHISSVRQQWLSQHAQLLHYMHTACLVCFRSSTRMNTPVICWHFNRVTIQFTNVAPTTITTKLMKALIF